MPQGTGNQNDLLNFVTDQLSASTTHVQTASNLNREDREVSEEIAKIFL